VAEILGADLTITEVLLGVLGNKMRVQSHSKTFSNRIIFYEQIILKVAGLTSSSMTEHLPVLGEWATPLLQDQVDSW